MRLTNDMRDKIANNLINATFRERRAAMAARERALALKIRDFALGKHREAFLALPTKLVPCEFNIGFNKAGQRRTLYFWRADVNPDRYQDYPVRFGGECDILPIPMNARQEGNSTDALVAIKATHPLALEHDAFEADRSTLKADIVILRRNTEALLDSFTTVEKLLAECPDLKPHLPAKKVETKKAALAVRGADILAMVAKAQAGGPLDKAA